MLSRQPERLALIIALASTLTVLMVVLIDLTLSYQRDLEEGEKQLLQFSNMVAEHTARTFEAIDILLNEVATDLSSNRNDWTSWSEVQGWTYIAQRHSRTMPQLRDLAIFDAHGKQRFVSSYFPTPAISIADRPYFQALAAGSHRSTFGPYLGRNSGQYTYAIARRLQGSDNRFNGIAFAAIEPAYMQDFCWSNRLSDDFDAVLTNLSGQIIASCRPSDLTRNSPILGQWAGEVLFDGRTMGMIPEQGQSRINGLLLSSVPVPGFSDLRLVAGMSEKAALSDWRGRMIEIGTLGALLCLVLLSGVQLMRRQLVELRSMADALAESRDQLETRVQESTAALAREKDAAERANAAKSRFLAAASHDLRQPLHALSLFSTDLQSQAAAGRMRETRRIAEQIGASTQALGEMLNALLDISRLDIDGVKADYQAFPLASLFARLNEAFYRQAAAHQLRLRFHPTRYYLHTDPRLLERILGNLIANAIRYTPAGGSILIGSRRQQGKIRLEVRDSGIGIAAENLESVFSEFFQVANTAREQDGGLGLGLSIVERLTRALNMDIAINSVLGHGTTFSLLIQGASAPAHSPSQLASSSGRVHFIGDSEELALCRQLVASWNYTCSCGDPASAERQSGDTVFICDAEMLARISPRPPLIVLCQQAPAELPADTHLLLTPLRPARLRALLRATASQRREEDDSA